MKVIPPADKELRIWKIVGLLFFGFVLLAALIECKMKDTTPCNRLAARSPGVSVASCEIIGASKKASYYK